MAKRRKLRMARGTRLRIDKATKAKKTRKKGQRINKGDRKRRSV